MIAVLKPEATQQQIENLVTWFKGQGLDVHISKGAYQTVLGLIGDVGHIDTDLVEMLDVVVSSVRDTAPVATRGKRPPVPDLTREDEAAKWIQSNPPSFCNTSDRTILQQVLNDYDCETHDFYRWKVKYSQQELAGLITDNLKTDFGNIIDLIPIERGRGGHICKLKIIGSLKQLIIGKELEIRRVLSKSHLYSSAFIVEKSDIKDDIPGTFTLTGAGWGHGVGMCQ